MNLNEALTFQFYVQNIFRLSVLSLKDFRAKKRSLVVSVLYTLSAALILTILLVNLAPGIIEVYAHNPVDQSSYSTTISQVPICCGTAITFAIWISVMVKHESETKFYQKICEIDLKLVKYDNLGNMHKKFLSGSRLTTMFPFVIHIIFGITSSYSYAKDGYYVFASTMATINVAFLYHSLYIGCFFLNVKLIRDRLNITKCLSESCDRIETFKDLTSIYKNLTETVVILTKTSGGIAGLILVNNFFGVACYAYMLIVSFMLWNDQRSDTFFDIFSILFPNVLMMLQGFLSGQWLINDVSSHSFLS